MNEQCAAEVYEGTFIYSCAQPTDQMFGLELGDYIATNHIHALEVIFDPLDHLHLQAHRHCWKQKLAATCPTEFDTNIGL